MGIDHREAGTPFEITHESRTELGIGRDAVLIGGLEQEVHPAFTFLFVEHFTDMVAEHRCMAAAVFLRIFFRTAEDFGNKVGDMAGMVGAHRAENRPQQVVQEDLIIETAEECLEGAFASGPFIKSRNRFHGEYLLIDGIAVVDPVRPDIVREIEQFHVGEMHGIKQCKGRPDIGAVLERAAAAVDDDLFLFVFFFE